MESRTSQAEQERIRSLLFVFNELCGSMQADKTKNIADIFKPKVGVLNFRANKLLASIHDMIEKKIPINSASIFEAAFQGKDINDVSIDDKVKIVNSLFNNLLLPSVVEQLQQSASQQLTKFKDMTRKNDHPLTAITGDNSLSNKLEGLCNKIKTNAPLDEKDAKALNKVFTIIYADGATGEAKSKNAKLKSEFIKSGMDADRYDTMHGQVMDIISDTRSVKSDLSRVQSQLAACRGFENLIQTAKAEIATSKLKGPAAERYLSIAVDKAAENTKDIDKYFTGVAKLADLEKKSDLSQEESDQLQSLKKSIPALHEQYGESIAEMESLKSDYQSLNHQLETKSQELIGAIKGAITEKSNNNVEAPTQKESFATLVPKSESEAKVTVDTKAAFVMINDMQKSINADPSVANIEENKQNFELRFSKYLNDQSQAPVIKAAYQDFSRKMSNMEIASAVSDIQVILDKKLNNPRYDAGKDLREFEQKFASQMGDKNRPIALIFEDAKKQINEIVGLSSKLGTIKLRAQDGGSKLSDRKSSSTEEPASPYTSPGMVRK